MAAAGMAALHGIRAMVVPFLLVTLVMIFVGVVAALISIFTVRAVTAVGVHFLPDQEVRESGCHLTYRRPTTTMTNQPPIDHSGATDFFTAIATALVYSLTAWQRFFNRRYGWACALLVGVCCGAATLVWPHHVSIFRLCFSKEYERFRRCLGWMNSKSNTYAHLITSSSSRNLYLRQAFQQHFGSRRDKPSGCCQMRTEYLCPSPAFIRHSFLRRVINFVASSPDKRCHPFCQTRAR